MLASCNFINDLRDSIRRVVYHGTAASPIASPIAAFQLGGLTILSIISTLVQSNFGWLKILVSSDKQKMHVNGQMREEKRKGHAVEMPSPHDDSPHVSHDLSWNRCSDVTSAHAFREKIGRINPAEWADNIGIL